MIGVVTQHWVADMLADGPPQKAFTRLQIMCTTMWRVCARTPVVGPLPIVVVLHERRGVVEEQLHGAAGQRPREPPPAEPAPVPLRQPRAQLQRHIGVVCALRRRLEMSVALRRDSVAAVVRRYICGRELVQQRQESGQCAIQLGGPMSACLQRKMVTCSIRASEPEGPWTGRKGDPLNASTALSTCH